MTFENGLFGLVVLRLGYEFFICVKNDSVKGGPTGYTLLILILLLINSHFLVKSYE